MNAPTNEERRPVGGAARTSTNPMPSLPSDLALDLEDRAAAWLAGYDLGLAHGRAAERAVIAQERASARAGAVVVTVADYPEATVDEARRRAAAREARWGK